MKENVERCGGSTVMVQDAWGSAVDLQKLEDALRANPGAKAVAFVHAETSTGAQSDAARIAEIAHRHDALVIADTVTSLGGTPVKVDQWGIDAVYSGTQKCLSCAPGLSPVSFGERAVHAIRNRRARVQSWFLDLNLIMGYWGSGQKRAYHHTAPVNALYGLHEALLILREEGLEQAWARHRHHHLALKAGLEALGLRFVVPEAERLPQLNAIAIPEGVDDARVRSRLLQELNIEIGAGLGELAGKVWRIGLMGHGCNARNVLLCIAALEAVLGQEGARVPQGFAVPAVQRALAAV
jgi:alanine-glyoxylate transaminase/serine-glyoxylate transaminase/serine-pyruvate transaminase